MSIKAHMICHTHWDREWYLTREEFRTKLVRLIDGLLDIVETVPEYVSFMLDGQTIAIEDYLEIKPYNREKLFAALKSGKIICGPWYILPDELLVSGESHIRNYLTGTEVIAETGKKMETAYLPDSFGHPEQMPQIVEGLGMNAMVFWRGVSKAVKQSEFYWESPFSDAKVLCIHLLNGYGNSANLSEDIAVTLPRVQEMIESLGAYSSTDLVLLMNGSDHIIGQKNICEIVNELNKQLNGCRIELSTLETYLEELKDRIGDLPSFQGELRSGERSMLLGGTLSTRMYLKQKNDTVQRKMERYLEPLLAVEMLSGKSYDSRGYRDYIWKKILENQPHDSICGCSIDEVHREMMARYACVEQLEDTLFHDAVNRSAVQSALPGRRASLFLFEPSQDELPSYMETELFLDEMLVQEVLFAKSIISDYEGMIEHPEMPCGLRIVDEQGREIPHVILGTGKDYTTLYQDHTAPEIYKANKLRVGLLLPGFTYGCHQIFAEPADTPSLWAMKENGTAIENEYYHLSVEQGVLCLLDKRTQKKYENFLCLRDGGDAGDEYTYSWPEYDSLYEADFASADVEREIQPGILQKLTLRGKMKLPEALTKDRKRRSEQMVSCPFCLEITLACGIERIDCHLEFENHAKDHRLQVQISSGVKADATESFYTFSVTQHPVALEVPEEWMEYPQATHPTHGYIGVCDENARAGIGTAGLTEYEAKDNGEKTDICLTLLRCVGWLSRTDLLTRHGNGGWTIETPEGQCLGSHTFDFCVTYHSDRRQEVFAAVDKFRCPTYLASLRAGTENGWISQEIGEMIKALPDGVRISACKPSENQKGVVLRLYSIAEEKKEILLPVPKAVKRVCITNMAEQEQRELDVKNGAAAFTICPKQIITLYMEL